MSVNLQKGQKVDLTKGNAGLTKVVVGLGWDAAPTRTGGLFSSRTQEIDCDASAIMCTNGKLLTSKDVVYYNNLAHSSGCVNHQGDNLTGDGDGDDEQIIVNLKQMPAEYDKLVFVVTIYQARERGQNFGMIRNAFIRIVDAATGTELCKFNLSEDYSGMTAMVFGEIYRRDGEWKFNAIGQGTTDNSIGEISKRFQ